MRLNLFRRRLGHVLYAVIKEAHPSHIVRVIVLCMQIHFEFWKMEEGPVEKLWHVEIIFF
ncbi:hypothetical protein T02_13330 [Trichinella nativa]|uniref:Uncharacterized protein n=1 Tax=Trichinella nativa TaxID=6335 RepID=A0A0V1LPQ3_9BILA|nr:hypothetical protein T02_13330 [Trichinella nativa]